MVACFETQGGRSTKSHEPTRNLVPFRVSSWIVLTEVTDARRVGNSFEITVNDEVVSSRKLLLATGVVDHLPDIEWLKPLSFVLPSWFFFLI